MTILLSVLGVVMVIAMGIKIWCDARMWDELANRRIRAIWRNVNGKPVKVYDAEESAS